MNRFLGFLNVYKFGLSKEFSVETQTFAIRKIFFQYFKCCSKVLHFVQKHSKKCMSDKGTIEALENVPVLVYNKMLIYREKSQESYEK